MAELGTADLAYALIRGGDQPPDSVNLRLTQCVIKETYDRAFVYPWPDGVPEDDPNTFFRGVDRVDISMTEAAEYTVQGVPVFSNYKPEKGDKAWLLVNDVDLVVVDRVCDFGPGLFTRTVRGLTVPSATRVFGAVWPSPATNPETIPNIGDGFIMNSVDAIMSNSGSYMVGFNATMKIIASTPQSPASAAGLILCHLRIVSPTYPEGTQYQLIDPYNMNVAFSGAIGAQARMGKVWMGEGLGPGCTGSRCTAESGPRRGTLTG